MALSVDVYCDNTYDKQPYYRLYVDGELLTERAWIWHTYETYIQENMEVDIDSGKHHVQIYLSIFCYVFFYWNLCVSNNYP